MPLTEIEIGSESTPLYMAPEAVYQDLSILCDMGWSTSVGSQRQSCQPQDSLLCGLFIPELSPPCSNSISGRPMFLRCAKLIRSSSNRRIIRIYNYSPSSLPRPLHPFVHHHSQSRVDSAATVSADETILTVLPIHLQPLRNLALSACFSGQRPKPPASYAA